MDTRSTVEKGNGRQAAAVTVFSGGTAANSLVDVFNRIIERRRCKLTYVIPISDNGGSSSELIRFLGGPSVGDIRSRLVRLIPNHGDSEERSALKSLFEHRLTSEPVKARSEWLDIVEARHLLWTSISSPKRELIRSVLNTLNLEIVKRVRPTSVFNFAGASVGNMFLTGARLFAGSFESAIYLLSMICSIPDSVEVLPAINSNFTHHISAGLADGSSIAGQVNISHPSAPTSLPDHGPTQAMAAPDPIPGTLSETLSEHAESGDREHDSIEDANLPGSLPALRRPHMAFSKDEEEDLTARIERVWYINPYGHEIWPVANPAVLAAVRRSAAVVYSIGSLYTSVVPSLVLRGVGTAVAAARARILILNSSIDRETGPRGQPMTALDFVCAVAKACAEGAGAGTGTGGHGAGAPGMGREGDGAERLRRYVSHVIYLEGDGAPAVDRMALERVGIVCVRIAGERAGQAGQSQDRRAALRYDEAELGKALEAVLDSV